MDVSRDTFCRYRDLVDYGGVDALIEKSRSAIHLLHRCYMGKLQAQKIT